MGRATWLAVMGLGCGPSAPLSPEAASQAQIAALQPMATRFLAALERCRATAITPLDEGAARAAPFPFDHAQLDAGCGEAGSFWDKSRVRLGGHDHATDVLLQSAARVGDDLEYMHTAFGHPGERANAWQHVRIALDDAQRAWSGLGRGWHGPHRALYRPGAEDRWVEDLQHDAFAVPNDLDHLERYAYRQGENPAAVRERMLRAYGDAETAMVRARLAAVESDVSPEERPARGAYLEAVLQWREAYDGVVAAWERADLSGRAPAREAANVALERWQAAAAAERARVGTP